MSARDGPTLPGTRRWNHSRSRGSKASARRILMDNIELPDASIQAYLRLMELNFGAWRPQVAEWLHSQEAEAPLKELLTMVPCSPTLH